MVLPGQSGRCRSAFAEGGMLIVRSHGAARESNLAAEKPGNDVGPKTECRTSAGDIDGAQLAVSGTSYRGVGISGLEVGDEADDTVRCIG